MQRKQLERASQLVEGSTKLITERDNMLKVLTESLEATRTELAARKKLELTASSAAEKAEAEMKLLEYVVPSRVSLWQLTDLRSEDRSCLRYGPD